MAKETPETVKNQIRRMSTRILAATYEEYAVSSDDSTLEIRRLILAELEDRKPDEVRRWQKMDAMPQSLADYVL